VAKSTKKPLARESRATPWTFLTGEFTPHKFLHYRASQFVFPLVEKSCVALRALFLERVGAGAKSGAGKNMVSKSCQMLDDLRALSET